MGSMHGADVQGLGLLERDAEMAALAGHLDALLDGGPGRIVGLAGPAGIGKTALLEDLIAATGATGVQVLRARAGELEQDFPYGVVRQLLEEPVHLRPESLEGPAAGAAPLLTGAPVNASPSTTPGDLRFATLHGLFHTLVNLSAGEHRGVLVAVDDAHWCDTATLAWLEYVGRRLASLPILVVVAARDAAGEGNAERVRALLDAAQAQVVVPGALSATAIAQLAARTLDGQPGRGFATAALEVTGGVPFLVTELLADLRSRDVRATREAVGSAGPASVARAIITRLDRVHPSAAPLARAVAVLGDPVALFAAADLAVVRRDEAGEVADALARADVLRPGRPLEFVHPIVRAAVYGHLPPAERSRLHRAAARQLDVAGSADRVANHLLSVEAAEDPWAAQILMRAGGEALTAGAPEAAVTYLRRAVEEPPPPEARATASALLGVAAATCRDEVAALEHLRTALTLAGDPGTRLIAGRALGQVLFVAGRHQQAIDVLTELIDGLDASDRETGLRLEGELFVAGFGGLGARQQVLARTRRFDWEGEVPATPGERIALAVRAVDTVVIEGEPERGGRQALRALGGGRMLADETSDSPAFYLAASTLISTNELSATHRVFTEAVDDARRRGSLRGLAFASAWRSVAGLRLGRIEEAVQDARNGLAAARELGIEFAVPLLVAAHMDALAERGDLDGAEGALAELEPRGLPPDGVMLGFLLQSRGALRLAQDRPAEALEDFQACGREQDAWRARGPVRAPWRSSSAIALIALGRADEAAELAATERRMAKELGLVRHEGVALRVHAEAVGGDEAVGMLEEACELLGSTPARLAHAKALAGLGGALRRTRRRREARAVLEKALGIAPAHGAVPLESRLVAELAAVGDRPARRDGPERDTLTPAERRVAVQAAAGLRNHEIAAALSLSERTVESHLGRVFAKLGIRSRVQLVGALPDDGA
jgi:DNA-binding CsgD family transcriptional regulator